MGRAWVFLVTAVVLAGTLPWLSASGGPMATLGLGYVSPHGLNSGVANGSEPNPYSSGMPAAIVLGQPNFTTGSSVPAGPASVGSDYSLTFDSAGDLWVADWNANRVLEFLPPFSLGMTAALVLGQSTFDGSEPGSGSSNLSHPDGVAFDAGGNLWVSDYGNNRVVEFLAPFHNGEAASQVVGQSTWSGTRNGGGPANLSGPAGLVFAQGSLWVSDLGNNRVLEFRSPIVTGEPAALALGQSNVTGNVSGTTSRNLSSPTGVTFDAAGDAWVSDFGNDRVVMFPPPLVTGEAATVVLGQSNFTARSTDAPNSFAEPNDVAIDPRGNVWVADSGHNRLLEFLGPIRSLPSNATPTRVLGQENLTGDGAATTRAGVDAPAALAFDPEGNLWVADFGNHRILEYSPTVYPITFQQSGLPSGTPWTLTAGSVVETGNSSAISFALTNGTYACSVGRISGYWAPGLNTSLRVDGAAVSITVSFLPFTYPVTVDEVGLPEGTSWNISIAGLTLPSRAASLGVNLSNGTYPYSVSVAPGFLPTPASGVVTVQGTPESLVVTFSAQLGNATNLPGPTPLGPASTAATAALVAGVLVVTTVALGAHFRRPRRPSPPESGADEDLLR